MAAFCLRDLRAVRADGAVAAAAAAGNEASAATRTTPLRARPMTPACLADRDATANVNMRFFSRGIAMFADISPALLARACVLLLLSGLTACTGSPATTALQPDFEMTTPAGVASVSLRQPLPAMTGAESTQLVMAGMEQAAPDNVIVGRAAPPFPSQRIVWHVHPSSSRCTSHLVVNVFDGANPYAYEETTITDSTPPMIVTSDIASMSKRLLADIAAQAHAPNRLGGTSHGTKRI